MFSVVYANGMLQYEISNEKIEKIWLTEYSKDEYIVRLLLKEPYKQEFSQLTGNNIGKRLEIIAAGKVLSRAVVKEKNDSGHIYAGKWDSEKGARKFIESLLPNKGKRNTH